nr:PREDICTED: enoyl-CoA delta isomerase 1, mitochondrial-like [Bemisia tabaci]
MTTVLQHVVRRSILRPFAKSFSSGSSLVDVQVNDKTGVAIVKMGRAPVNGLNTELLGALNDTFDSLEKNKATGMILSSSIPNIYSAGLDISEMYNGTPENLTKFWNTLQSMWINLYSTPLPTVALINGNAPAGGCLLAMSCEYRVMVGSKFVIGLNETQLGLFAPKWFQDTMVSIIGPRQTELALTSGKLFSAQEALKIGLIDELVASEEEALASSDKFFGLFKRIPGYARGQTKNFVRAEVLDWLLKNREHDTKVFLNSIQLPHVQKGLGLYLQSLKKK